VIILTGTYDLIDGIETSRTQPTVGNVEQMLTAFENAKIPAVVCYMLSSSEYDSYYYDFVWKIYPVRDHPLRCHSIIPTILFQSRTV